MGNDNSTPQDTDDTDDKTTNTTPQKHDTQHHATHDHQETTTQPQNLPHAETLPTTNRADDAAADDAATTTPTESDRRTHGSFIVHDDQTPATSNHRGELHVQAERADESPALLACEGPAAASTPAAATPCLASSTTPPDTADSPDSHSDDASLSPASAGRRGTWSPSKASPSRRAVSRASPLRAASGAHAHAGILAQLQTLQEGLPQASRPVARSAAPRDQKREMARVAAARLIQRECRLRRTHALLRSNTIHDEARQRDLLLSDVVSSAGVGAASADAPRPALAVSEPALQSGNSGGVMRFFGSLLSSATSNKRSSTAGPARSSTADSAAAADAVIVDMAAQRRTSTNRVEVRPPPPPSAKVAAEYASLRLARQQAGDPSPGELYPLYTPIETFDRFGADMSQYVHFVYYTARLFLGLFLLNLSNIIINWEGGYLGQLGLDSASGVNPIAVWHTLGNAERRGVLGKGGFSYSIVEFLTAAILTVYLFWIRTQMAIVRQRIRSSVSLNTLTAADFTVLVKRLPPSWSSDDVKNFFSAYGDVVHVGLSLDNRELVLKMQHVRELRESHTDASLGLLTAMSKMARKEEIMGARKEALASLQRFEACKRTMRALMRQRYRTTGHAFVTFNRSRIAQQVVRCSATERQHPTKGTAPQTRRRAISSALRHNGMTVERAPEPSDVLWENMVYSPASQWRRQLLSTSILIVLMGIGITVIFISNFYLQPGAHPDIKADTTASSFGLMLAATLVNVAGHLVFFLSIVALALAIERQHTRGERERVMMVKMTIFQVLAVVVQAILFLYFDVAASQLVPVSNGHFTPDWYVSGGQVVLSALLGDVLVIGLFIDFVRPIPDLARRYVLGRKAMTQAKKNELWSASGELVLGYRIQLMNKIVVVGLMFSFAIPFLYLIIFLYLWSAHWVDRHVFLRRVRPPPITETQMEIVISYIFPCAVLAHVIMAVIFFSDLCAGSEEHVAQELKCDSVLGAPAAAAAADDVAACIAEDAAAATTTAGAAVEAAVRAILPAGTPASWRSSVASGIAAQNWTAAAVSSASTVAIECLIANETEVATLGGNESGTLCFSQPSGCTTEWGGANFVILASAALWGSIVIVYLVRAHMSYRRRHATNAGTASRMSDRSKEGWGGTGARGDDDSGDDASDDEALADDDTISSGTAARAGRLAARRAYWRRRGAGCCFSCCCSGDGGFFLNLWRFLVQHDVRRLETISPPDARVWDSEQEMMRNEARALRGEPPVESGAAADAANTKTAAAPPSLLAQRPVLHPDTQMYLPPLTHGLLSMELTEGRLDRKLLKSYLQIADAPIQQAPGGGMPEPAPRTGWRMSSALNPVDQAKQVRDVLRRQLEQVETHLTALDERALNLGNKYRSARASIRGRAGGRRSPQSADAPPDADGGGASPASADGGAIRYELHSLAEERADGDLPSSPRGGEY